MAGLAENTFDFGGELVFEFGLPCVLDGLEAHVAGREDDDDERTP